MTLRGGQILSNTADVGGGIDINSGNATLTGGEITNNHARYDGGGMFVAGQATLSGGQFSGNTAERNGGGVCSNSSAIFTQTGASTITLNVAQSSGGGIYATGRVVLSGGHIFDNIAPQGSALSNRGSVTPTVALTISGDVYQRSGAFNGGSTPLRIEGSLVVAGGVFDAPIGGLTLTDYFTHTGGTYRQTQDINGSAEVGFPKAGGIIVNANSQDLGSTQVTIQAGVECTTASGEAVRHCYKHHTHEQLKRQRDDHVLL